MSDQVYVDTLASYRDALELATRIRDNALAYLTAMVDVKDGKALLWNSLLQPRLTNHRLASGTHTATTAIPSVGYRAVTPTPLVEAESPDPGGSLGSELVLESSFLKVTIDLQAGGTIRSIEDKRGWELLTGAGNDLIVCEEYPVLPGHGEGPWHLAPTGERRAGTSSPARVIEFDVKQRRVVLEADYPEFRKRQTIQLASSGPRIEFDTEIIRWSGRNQLVRVVFPIDRADALRGTLPIHQTAAAVIGRPFARDVDSATDPWTLDQACWQWAGLGTLLSVQVTDAQDEVIHERALGVGELVLPSNATSELRVLANKLAAALVARGVTTTISDSESRR